MAADTYEEGKYPRRAKAMTFFRYSFVCLAVLSGVLAIAGVYKLIASLHKTIPPCSGICIALVTAAIIAGKSISVLNRCTKRLKPVLRRLEARRSETNCLLVALLIRAICDPCVDVIDDMRPLVAFSVLSLVMICLVATSSGCDPSGMTEGLIVEFGKMLIVYLMASKLWQPIICGLVLVFAIVSMLTELGHEATDGKSLPVRRGDSTCLLGKIDSGGEYQTVMQRSAWVIMLLRLSAVFITVLGGIITIMYAYDRIPSQYRTLSISFCLVLETILFFAGGLTLYVKLLQWVLQRLRARKDKWWLPAIVILALCDAFLDIDKMLPLAVLSTLSMIMLYVITTGWDSDCTSLSEGLILGFGKWLAVYVIEWKLSQSVICGLILLFVAISKLSEHADAATNVENSLRAGDDALTCATTKN